MKLDVLLIEDDVHFLADLVRLVQSKMSDYQIEMHYDTKTDHFLEHQYTKNYDLAFLDIDLIDGEDGIEVAKMLKQANIVKYIIFVSCQQHLVFQSLLVQPFYFIRKSCLEEELDIALKLLMAQMHQDKKVILQVSGRTLIFKVSDLYYFEILNHDAVLYFKEKSYTVPSTMVKMLDKLNSRQMIQVHRSFAVNAFHVLEIYTNEVELSNRVKIPLGRKYRKDFLNKYREIL